MFTAVPPLLVPVIFAERYKSLRVKAGERRKREKKQLSAAVAFVKVNDEHQKPQTREKKINKWLTSAAE